MSIHLYKHNEDAYRAVETMLEEKQMAAVIHPTGTGKSMIAFKLVEQHPHKHFLWLSPSEYIYKTQLENIDTQFSNIEYMSYSRLMKHAQLVFTTHDTWQLSNQLLRRDEIWFTEKDNDGLSTLYSLADFVDEDGSRIRKDESYEKNYLLGKYGAIPSLKTIEFFKGE